MRPATPRRDNDLLAPQNATGDAACGGPPERRDFCWLCESATKTYENINSLKPWGTQSDFSLENTIRPHFLSIPISGQETDGVLKRAFVQIVFSLANFAGFPFMPKGSGRFFISFASRSKWLAQGKAPGPNFPLLVVTVWVLLAGFEAGPQKGLPFSTERRNADCSLRRAALVRRSFRPFLSRIQK